MIKMIIQNFKLLRNFGQKFKSPKKKKNVLLKNGEGK